MPIKLIEVSTLSKIPAYVPLGVFYLTADTGNLYVGTGSATGASTILVSGGEGSAFIDSATAVLVPNTTAPFLPTGSYTYYVAITDGKGNWSNLASFTFTADGSHNYAVTWNPPTTWWSLGTGTQLSNIFTDNTKVSAWVSFNGGAIQSVTPATAGSLGFIGYNFWQPYVRIGGGYVGGNTPIPTLNTLPAINLTTGGPMAQGTGLVLNAPTMGWINISQQANFGSPSGQGLTIADANN